MATLLLPQLKSTDPKDVLPWAQNLVKSLQDGMSTVTEYIYPESLNGSLTLAPGSIDGSGPYSPIKRFTIDTTALENAAVTTAKLADLAVDNDKLAALSVDAAKLAGVAIGATINVTGIVAGKCSTSNT